MTNALVLGGGGIAGIAWEAGIVEGLRRDGVDLGTADLIVGTSAGSVVGSLVAAGADLETRIMELATAPTPPTPDLEALLAEYVTIYAEGLEPAELRRRIGRLALAADAGPEETRLEAIADRLLGYDAWPDRRLLITAVDTATGDFVVWDRDSGVPLPRAVASSCAVPGVYPPVTINGRRYMDGGVRSGTNADLAKGASALVLLDPLAHMWPPEPRRQEIAEVAADATAEILPDAAAAEIFGVNVLDPALWKPAFAAGLEQAVSIQVEGW